MTEACLAKLIVKPGDVKELMTFSVSVFSTRFYRTASNVPSFKLTRGIDRRREHGNRRGGLGAMAKQRGSETFSDQK